ncbi:hypothetical protein [Sphingorhabdus sp. Alg239-R122]|uniref:hypothetical protein n=1 Tax=Sphingorhabdus sp. Alg239-R122 TaxID=2305989 RepID=UPI0013DA60EA|nr:hypothetical protein [Sphingorhabdus sp. Alg239-R122]
MRKVSIKCIEGGDPVDMRLIVEMAGPYVDMAANDMRRTKINGDDAAAALIINLTNGLSEQGNLIDLEKARSDSFRSLFTLYCFYCNSMFDVPEKYIRAKSLFNNDIFKKVLDI